MKESTIEQKAERYDKVVSKLKSFMAQGVDPLITRADVQDFFPELKESEGERIRACIEMCLTDANEQRFKDYNTSLKECLDWLEKQGKLVAYYEDKLDRCACENFNKGYKKALEMQGEQKLIVWHKEDEQNLNVCLSYIPDEYLRRWLKDVVHVKYDKPTDKVEPKFKVGDKIRKKTPSSFDRDMQVARIEKDYYICNHIGKFSSEVVPFSKECSYELIEQKPAWSENDEKIYSRICALIHSAAYKNYDVDEDGNECGEYAKIINWFKSLKERVQPRPKQEWSEDDEKNFNEAISYIKDTALRNWLKSRVGCEVDCTNTWKPSDLQIEALESATANCAYSEYEDCLTDLIEQLKKLRKE